MTTPDSINTTAGSSWRRRFEYVVPSMALAVVIAAPWMYWDRLPDPVATHWGFSGAPDDSGSLLANAVMLPVVTALMAFGPLLATRAPMPRFMARILVGLSWGTAVLFTLVRIYSLEANADAATWDVAGPINGPMMAAAFGAAIIAGLAGAWLAGDRPDIARATRTVEAMDVQPGEAVVWTSGASGLVPSVLAPVILILGGVGMWLLPAPARFFVGGLHALVAIMLAMFGQCRVIVGPAGLTVRLGWFDWPRMSVKTQDITDVQVENINPMSYGGWGLRSVPGALAVVVRSGEGIRVTRTNGRVLVVSVDDAQTGASVLLAHVQANQVV